MPEPVRGLGIDTSELTRLLQAAEERYAAATNVGVRPTVDGQALTVEAHLLDFTGDLYGRQMRLVFIERIRPEKKFGGLDELKAQIAADVAEVRRQLPRFT